MTAMDSTGFVSFDSTTATYGSNILRNPNSDVTVSNQLAYHYLPPDHAGYTKRLHMSNGLTGNLIQNSGTKSSDLYFGCRSKKRHADEMYKGCISSSKLPSKINARPDGVHLNYWAGNVALSTEPCVSSQKPSKRARHGITKNVQFPLIHSNKGTPKLKSKLSVSVKTAADVSSEVFARNLKSNKSKNLVLANDKQNLKQLKSKLSEKSIARAEQKYQPRSPSTSFSHLYEIEEQLGAGGQGTVFAGKIKLNNLDL